MAPPRAPTKSGRQLADLLVSGGRIVTCDPARPEASVLAVRDGRIAALGGSEILGAWDAVEWLELGGRTVIPGLVDAHVHLLGLGRSKDELDLRGLSFEEIVERVRRAVEGLPAGETILGRGWNQAGWPGAAMPAHGALSAAAPEHPVLLRRIDGHATLANLRAMELAGIGLATAAPPGGEILRDREGLPTGVFVDAAADLLPAAPAPSRARLERWLLAAQQACLEAGLTCVHDAGADEETLALLDDLGRDGRLLLRVNAMLLGRFDERDEPEPAVAARLAKGPMQGLHDGRLTMRAVKMFADGALGSHGAALLEPYCDRPGSCGLLQLTRESLAARVRACVAAGFQPAVHAIGDAANRMVLDAYEEVLGARARTDHRFRIEHAQVLSPQDVPRFGRLCVLASVQPTHATSDMAVAGLRLGEGRLAGAYAWRSLLDSGARLALGSDVPVESENPFRGIFAACERTDDAGRPTGGWRPAERLTREEALRGFCADAAFAGFDEDELGSLGPGRRADFLVLSEDPLACPPDRLLRLVPDETLVAGRSIRHGSPPS